ncbi:hypothetical protein PC9H_008867 [Pleurotus ostreatus]|uniref:Mug135-like C-terminal domain-containing protein n=1 Tax=Pleurotus ostreatus TaxID=5322 RepID=A0A8H7DS13_PLEOS|nr:uncharacterized protein PC9H_008867 [Pleurotus ostreatus]KAF7426498.1 hypothetical protein PC9H_008867 [Pleurotus ostreatus]
MLGEGRRTLSWIWYTVSDEELSDPGEVQACLRVEWVKAHTARSASLLHLHTTAPASLLSSYTRHTRVLGAGCCVLGTEAREGHRTDKLATRLPNDALPNLVQPLGSITNFRNARSHAAVLQGYAGRPDGDPRHVPLAEADKAHARAIQLATLVPFDDIPREWPIASSLALRLNRPGSNAATLQEILTKLDGLEDRLTAKVDAVEVAIGQRIARLEETVRASTIASLRALNGAREEGALIPYEIIPFPDGKHPTDAEFQKHNQRHPFPLLRKMANIVQLNRGDLLRYLQHYGITPANMPADEPGRHKLLCEMIGVSVIVIRHHFA